MFNPFALAMSNCLFDLRFVRTPLKTLLLRMFRQSNRFHKTTLPLRIYNTLAGDDR